MGVSQWASAENDKCQDIVDRKMCHNIVDKLH